MEIVSVPKGDTLLGGRTVCPSVKCPRETFCTSVVSGETICTSVECPGGGIQLRGHFALRLRLILMSKGTLGNNN